MSIANQSLRELHKRYCDQIDEGIEKGLAKDDPDLAGYNTESQSYLDSTNPNSYQPVRKGDFIDDIVSRQTPGILYVGDFHPESRSKELLIEITRQVAERGRRVTWVLEAVREKHSKEIRRYRAHGDVNRFLDDIGIEEFLGTDPSSYAHLFNTARSERVSIKPGGVRRGYTTISLTDDDQELGRKTEQRPMKDVDDDIAEIVANEYVTNSDALICVLYGDNHLTPTHLPDRVREKLKEQRIEPPESRIVIAAQGSVYDRLLERDVDRANMYLVNGQQVEDSKGLTTKMYAVLNTTPLERVLSRNLNGEPEASEDGFEETDREISHEHFLNIVNIVANYLGIKKSEPQEGEKPDEDEGLEDDNIEIFTGNSGKESFREEHVENKLERERMRRRLEKDASIVLSDGRLFVRNRQIRDLSELAGVFLQFSYLNKEGIEFDEGMTREDHFYYTVLQHAMSYFGSKVINPTRIYRSQEDFEHILKSVGVNIRKETETQVVELKGKKERAEPVFWTSKKGSIKRLTPEEASGKIQELEAHLNGKADVELARTTDKVDDKYGFGKKIWRQAELALDFPTQGLPPLPREEDFAPKPDKQGTITKTEEKRAAEKLKEAVVRVENQRDDLAEILGFQLGHKLFEAVTEGRVDVSVVRDRLFLKHLSKPETPHRVYGALAKEVEGFGKERYDDYL